MTVEAAPKTSGAPGSGAVLSAESFDQFAKALGSGEPPAPEPAEPAAPPAPPAPAAEEGAAAPPPAAPPPAPEEEPKGPIPYERFKAVNEERKGALAKQAEYEKELAALRDDVDKRANDEAARKLFEIARQNPELEPYIFGGQKPAPKPADAPPAAPKAPPADPVQARFEAIERQNAEISKNLAAEQKAREQRERLEMLDSIQDRAETQMKKHPQLQEAHPMYAMGAELVAHLISREPKTPIETIVDRVGNYLKKAENEIKDKYVVAKKSASTSVSPGVGPGAPPAPPGTAKPKLKLGDGSIARAMAAAMDAQAKAATE